MSAESKMLKARAQLLMENPFFGVLALKLKLVQKEDVRTAAVDGVHLFYASKFIEKLSNPEVKGLIAHEVFHCVWNHMTRRHNRDPKLWNIACDYAINWHLVHECHFILPKDGLLDGDYKDMTADAIYNALPKEDAEQCPWGLVVDAPNGGLDQPKTAGAIEADWQVSVNQALSTAKQQGKLPAGMETHLRDIVKPVVPWRSILWPFCTSITNDDYSWRKPNRAYISEDEYLPSLYTEGAGHFAVIIDTSGSCMDEYEPFMAEIKAIHAELRPEKLTIIHADAEVAFTRHVDKFDEFPIDKVYGGGGTDFEPAFDWIDEHCPEIDAAVYLTDMYGNFGDPRSYPVLWCATTNVEPPWGQYCRVTLD
tara:strand:+ start:4395 stop:5492 length:1098 start_codon:yes stop_codon:yes gene_type:complete